MPNPVERAETRLLWYRGLSGIASPERVAQELAEARAAAPAANLRRRERYTYQTYVEVITPKLAAFDDDAHIALRAFALDLSTGGLCVLAPRVLVPPFSAAACPRLEAAEVFRPTVVMEVGLPERDGLCRLAARVRFVRPVAHDYAQVGFQFVDRSPLG